MYCLSQKELVCNLPIRHRSAAINALYIKCVIEIGDSAGCIQCSSLQIPKLKMFLSVSYSDALSCSYCSWWMEECNYGTLGE